MAREQTVILASSFLCQPTESQVTNALRTAMGTRGREVARVRGREVVTPQHHSFQFRPWFVQHSFHACGSEPQTLRHFEASSKPPTRANPAPGSTLQQQLGVWSNAQIKFMTRPNINISTSTSKPRNKEEQPFDS